jgi:hypothetical protein
VSRLVRTGQSSFSAHAAPGPDRPTLAEAEETSRRGRTAEVARPSLGPRARAVARPHCDGETVAGPHADEHTRWRRLPDWPCEQTRSCPLRRVECRLRCGRCSGREDRSGQRQQQWCSEPPQPSECRRSARRQPCALSSAREGRTFKPGHRERILRRTTGCLMAIVKSQAQVLRDVVGDHAAVHAVFESRPGARSGRRHRGGSVSSPEQPPGEEKGAR